jgi:precorrin-4/cobalt-precorrin-4 C11-methyltransferase
MNDEVNQVIFVGAGPGDPELISVKGMKALENADLIIYAGSLVPEAVLIWAKESAKILNSASMHLEEIITAIKEIHNDNGRVVRLHTGDPALYGAIYEQMKELDIVNIPYKVIPGITAAFAAAAAMNIEYTLPEITQTLILTRISGRTKVPETESLESLAKHQASLAIYLSIMHVEKVGEILSSAYGPDANCAVAFRVSQPEQKIFYTKASEVAALVKEKKIDHQALIIISKSLDVKASGLGLKYKSKLYAEDFKHGYRNG